MSSLKRVSVVYAPTLTKFQLERPFTKRDPKGCDFDTLWSSYAEYVMAVYSEYHMTERLRSPDESFFHDVCYIQLRGATEPEELVDIYEALTREHQTYILKVMEEIVNSEGYLRSIQANWYRLANDKVMPMLIFETCSLYDLIETESTCSQSDNE